MAAAFAPERPRRDTPRVPAPPRLPAPLRRAVTAALAVFALGCSRTPLDAPAPETGLIAAPERCNRLDDDLDGQVDEDFRDLLGA